MTRDFEGKTEQEAIALAVAELHLEQADFDVEILDNGKKGLFKKGLVKIRIHLNDEYLDESYAEDEEDSFDGENDDEYDDESLSDDACTASDDLLQDFEQKVADYVATIVAKMGYQAKVQVKYRKEGKLCLDISSASSSIIIGRKGKNLDALQLLVNVFAGQLSPGIKVILDSENYRIRHEEQLVRLAYKTAEQVKRSGRSKLLEPMNPFERRLVHTALNDMEGILTKSEGDGLYKQIRVSLDDDLPPLRN
jgi:spoIIIJ-associated protein